MTDLLEAVELQTHDSCDWSIIWMHGLGADGSDFVPIIPELGLDPALRLRFVFPNAPEIPVTCNGGYVMPAWFDIVSLDKNTREVDVAGIVASRQRIRDLIQREQAQGIPAERVFLAGFSQGGAVAYAAGLTHPEPLAGIIALSTYLPVPDLVTQEATESNRTVPIFVAHGLEDEVVSRDMGMRAQHYLSEHGYACQWHGYPMGHTLCLEEVRDIGAWLNHRIAAN